MITERTNASAIALVGPYSTGRKACPQRRQLQPGSDCLHVDRDGRITIDAAGPARIIDTTLRWAWVRRVGSIVQTLRRRKQRAEIPKTAIRVETERPQFAVPGCQSTANSALKRTALRWRMVSISMAFAGLFVLGMAVEHRAEIINWKVLRLAIDGRVPPTRIAAATAVTKPKAPAPAPAPHTATVAVSEHTMSLPAPMAPVTGSATIAVQAALPPAMGMKPTLQYAPAELPAPLPLVTETLLDHAPRYVRHRVVEHSPQRNERPDTQQAPAVDVVLRNLKGAHEPTSQGHMHAQAQDNGVDVKINPPPAPKKSPGAQQPERQVSGTTTGPDFKAVTTNGGALVVRNTNTNKFNQVAPGARLPNGQTLIRINEDHGTYTTNAGTFNYGD